MEYGTIITYTENRSRIIVILSNSEEIITCGRHKNTQCKLHRWKEQRDNTKSPCMEYGTILILAEIS